MSKKKDKKPKGPIRTGAVVPFLIIVTLTTVFNIFFLDSTVKKVIEAAGESANGAEVNVGEVNISITSLKSEIKNIQFTDKANPDFNKFEIGLIEFQALWDALLRAKLVINIVQVKDIKINTKRKYKGEVFPDPPANSDESKATKEILANTQKEFEGNILGDLSSVLSGSKVSKEASIEGNLKSKKRYEEISKEIDIKGKEMDQAFKNLPKEEELNSLKDRFNKIPWNDLTNISKAPRAIQEIDKLKRDIDKTKKKYEDANKLVNSNINYINQSQKDIKRLVQEDISDIEKRMKIPKLDATSIAKILFGDEALTYLEKFESFQGKIKDYLPPKKEKKEEPDFVKKPRGKGRDYVFGTPKSYPPFWVKKVAINSLNDQGTVKGEINHITTSQRLINKPTTLKINGEFAKVGVKGLDISGHFDHRSGSDDKISVVVGRYPVENKALSKSNSAKLIIDKANGDANLLIHLKDENVNLSVNNYYRNINYEHSAEDKTLNELLAEVAKTTQTISVNAKAKGKFKSLKWDIKSNLANAFQKSVRNLVQGKIDAAKKKIEDDINKQISGQKKQIDDQLAQFKSKYQSELNKGQAEFDKLKSQVDEKKKKTEKDASKSIENKAKNLLKKIKF